MEQKEIFMLPTSIKNQIIESINMGYNQIQIGYISKKTKGIALTNSKYQVRGTYPIELKEIIEKLILNSF